MRLGHLRQDDDQDAHESTGQSGEEQARSPTTIKWLMRASAVPRRLTPVGAEAARPMR